MASVRDHRRVYSVNRVLQTATALRHVWLISGLMALYCLLPLWKEWSHYEDVADLPSTVSAVFSMVMGLLLVFRTNRVYDRWWEARSLWGWLVSVSRNLAVKIESFLNLERSEREEVRHLIAGYARALAGHLRKGAKLNNLPGFEQAEGDPEHVPAHISGMIYQRLANWKRAGRVSEQELRIMDEEARVLLKICGDCERIRNTLIAGSYRLFTIKCLLLYLLTLPWGLVHEFSYWTVPISVVLTYLMVGLEAIAETVEEPFGQDLDDLDLEYLCDQIDASVGEILKMEQGTAPTPSGAAQLADEVS